jgi:(p)ppGpp synthase/HD superfamily hydrolase
MDQVLFRPPGYERFFAPLEVVLDPNQFERVRAAYIFSKHGHAGQTRDDGSRYFDHPKSAAWIYIDEFGGRDPEQIIDILLHDLSEDTYLLSPYRISLNFGEDRALDIRALTKLPKGKESTEEYLERVCARGPRTIFAKLCDRLHNLRCIDACTVEKRVAQIKETENYHLRLLIPRLHATEEPTWHTQAQLMKRKIIEAIMSVK